MLIICIRSIYIHIYSSLSEQCKKNTSLCSYFLLIFFLWVCISSLSENLVCFDFSFSPQNWFVPPATVWMICYSRGGKWEIRSTKSYLGVTWLFYFVYCCFNLDKKKTKRFSDANSALYQLSGHLLCSDVLELAEQYIYLKWTRSKIMKLCFD